VTSLTRIGPVSVSAVTSFAPARTMMPPSWVRAVTLPAMVSNRIGPVSVCTVTSPDAPRTAMLPSSVSTATAPTSARSIGPVSRCPLTFTSAGTETS
jgi:hypothetical protein